MKKRDGILFTLPILAIGFLCLFAFLLMWQLDKFEQSYRSEAEKNITQETRLVGMIITPLLAEGKLEEAFDFCNSFKNQDLRLSLIAEDGKVEADSVEEITLLDNHADRNEVKQAFAGESTTALRYSDSLQEWLIYHAMLLDTPKGKYVLRSAISADKVAKMLEMSKVSIILAVFLGAWVVLLLTIYIVNRIRQPLVKLQDSTNNIAIGKLNTEIEIPEKGIVRDLALSIKAMTIELNKQLKLVTLERNEKDNLLDSMDNSVLVIDENCNAVKFNHAAQELFAIKSKHSPFNVARANVSNLVNEVNQAFCKNQNFEKEFELNQHGMKLTLLIKSRLLSENHDKLLLLNITNLSNLRKLESFRSDFVANVSHEIKTPLTSIMGAIEILNEHKNLSSEENEKLFSIINKESKRLNLLVQDILSLASLEKRQLNPQQDFEFTGLDSILSSAVNACKLTAEERGISCEIIKNTQIDLCVDSQLIEQAIVNLIQNAIKYSNSPKIEVSLSKEDGKFAVIQVKDFGVGISEEHQRRIFERFYRVHKERSRNSGGTGLGLAIVKHIVQLHGGTISLTSQVNQGCVFTIKLPCEEA